MSELSVMRVCGLRRTSCKFGVSDAHASGRMPLLEQNAVISATSPLNFPAHSLLSVSVVHHV
jgi:hypothetical protein